MNGDFYGVYDELKEYYFSRLSSLAYSCKIPIVKDVHLGSKE